MVSLAVEQWPDTVLPSTVEDISSFGKYTHMLRVAPQHLFHAWAQISLELANVDCRVRCHFTNECIQKTLVYGVRTMPLRIREIVDVCDMRGIIKHSDTSLDIICTTRDGKFDCLTGWRVSPGQVTELEVLTRKGCLRMCVAPSNDKPYEWFTKDTADELSCWLWTISNKKNQRCNIRLDIGHLLTENMKNILN